MNSVKKTIAKLKVKNLVIVEVPKKSSWVYNHFGHLCVRKTVDGVERNENVGCEHIFCRLCLHVSKEQAQGNEELTLSEAKPIQAYGGQTSTNNLSRHLELEHKVTQPLAATKPKYDLKSFWETNESGTKKSKLDPKFYLARDLVCMLAREMQPFTFVVSEGFVDFCLARGLITSRNDMPSRSTLGGTALLDVYRSAKLEVKKILESSPMWGALTSDLWTDTVAKNPYITFTYHFVDDKINLVKLSLGTQLIQGAHTGENIKGALNNILKEYRLDHKDIFLTTDGGRNIRKAVRLSSKEGLICLGHSLHNLVLSDGINKVLVIKKAVKNARKAVVKLRYKADVIRDRADHDKKLQRLLEILSDCDGIEDMLSCDEDLLIADESDSEEDEDEHPERKMNSLKLDCPTRWHSILIMIESLGDNRATINGLLVEFDHTDLCLSEVEWQILLDLKQFLAIFKITTEKLSSEKATVNKILVLRAELQTHLLEKPDDSKPIKDLKSKMRLKFVLRFPISKHAVLGSLLDPLYLNLKAVNEFFVITAPFD